MTNSYINKINQKKEKENLRQAILFGQGTGVVILIIAGLKFLDIISPQTELILKCLMIIGVILIITGIVFPYVLYYPSKWFKKIINKFFLAILLCILTIVYLLLLVPIGLITRKKWAQQYGFFSWNQQRNDIKWKGFSNRENRIKNNSKRQNRISAIMATIGYFVERKNFILIPLLCMLLLISLLFFFVTSSIVTPMIYTLF